MSLPRKSDVKSHLSARGRAASAPFQPASEQNTGELIETELVEIKVDEETFVQDFTGEHSPSSSPRHIGAPSTPPL